MLTMNFQNQRNLNFAGQIMENNGKFWNWATKFFGVLYGELRHRRFCVFDCEILFLIDIGLKFYIYRTQILGGILTELDSWIQQPEFEVHHSSRRAERIAPVQRGLEAEALGNFRNMKIVNFKNVSGLLIDIFLLATDFLCI